MNSISLNVINSRIFLISIRTYWQVFYDDKNIINNKKRTLVTEFQIYCITTVHPILKSSPPFLPNPSTWSGASTYRLRPGDTSKKMECNKGQK